MNEISILMHLLSNKKNMHTIGATKKEIIQTLNIKNKNRNIEFQNLVTHLSKYTEPLGLQVRYNPINSHWFISYDSDISDLISANPFENKPKLAATLFCILVLCLKSPDGTTKIIDLQNIRKKKNVVEDLKELEQIGYLEIEKDSNLIKLSPLIGYQLDFEKLFVKLALKLKD